MVCRNNHRIFTSSRHQMTILFRSDRSRTHRGFQAYYYSFLTSSSITRPSTSSSSLPMSPTTEYNSCGGLLSSPSGTLQSPFYPRNYPNNANCDWATEAKNNIRVTLSFRVVQMEGGRCLSDYVEVYDGPLHTSPLLGKFCSGSFRTCTSSSNLLTIRFHGKSRYAYKGFQADYYPTPADQSTALLCLPDYMRVAVSRYYLQSHGYSAWHLILKDPYCKPNITSNSVIFKIPYTRCGTVREKLEVPDFSTADFLENNVFTVHIAVKIRCVRDSTYATYYSPFRYMVWFKFNAFQFIRHNPLVYLQCELVVYRAYDYSSRCYQGHVTRSKREASSGQESVTVVAGPIRLKEAGAENRNERDVK
ncbi:scavenger receptor cysteine-rich domain-containing protein DMBT1-like [Guaruba guarouba]